MKQIQPNGKSKKSGTGKFLPVIAFANGAKSMQILAPEQLAYLLEANQQTAPIKLSWQPDQVKKCLKSLNYTLPPALKRRIAVNASSVSLEPNIGLKVIAASGFSDKKLAMAEYDRILGMIAESMKNENDAINTARNTSNKINEEQRFWQGFDLFRSSGEWLKSRETETALHSDFGPNIEPLFVYDLCVKLGVQAEMVLFADRVAVRTNNIIFDMDSPNHYKIKIMNREERIGFHSDGGLSHAMSHIFVLIGDEMRKNDKWENALTFFVKSIEFDPKYATAWNRAGRALYNLGMLKDAAIYNRKTIRLAKTDIARANGYYNLALTCKSIATPLSIAEGISACDAAITLNSRGANAYIVKAELQDMLGKSDDALKTCRNAIELFPHKTEQEINSLPENFKNIYLVMREIYLARGNFGEAENSFVRYLELGGKIEDGGNA